MFSLRSTTNLLEYSYRQFNTLNLGSFSGEPYRLNVYMNLNSYLRVTYNISPTLRIHISHIYRSHSRMKLNTKLIGCIIDENYEEINKIKSI